MSSVTGDGIDEFFEAVDASRGEYERYVNAGCPFRRVLMSYREYLPELERARAARDKSLRDMRDESMTRLTRDLAIDKQQNQALNQAWEEEDEDVDEEGGDDIIDRCES